MSEVLRSMYPHRGRRAAFHQQISGVINQLWYLINTTSRPNMFGQPGGGILSLSLFLNTLLSLSVLLPVSSQPLTGRGSQALDIQEEWPWQWTAY